MISGGREDEINENGAFYVSNHCFSESNTKLFFNLRVTFLLLYIFNCFEQYNHILNDEHNFVVLTQISNIFTVVDI